MNRTELENLLGAEGEKYRLLIAPENTENRMKKTIRRTGKKKDFRRKLPLVAALLLVFLLGSNLSTLAYYGKRIIGYEKVMNFTLQNLAEMGKGQDISQKVTWEESGAEVTLDAIMVDDNQLLAFYRIHSPEGEISDSLLFPYFQGLFHKYRQRGGQGYYDEEKKEISWVMSFDPPRFWERKLIFSFTFPEGGDTELKKIEFLLNREDFMQKTLKKELKEQFSAGETTIRLKSIQATPTMTVIEGELQNSLELIADHLAGERMRPGNLRLKLVADGNSIPVQGGGMRTDHRGISFHQNFDALPSDLKELIIVIESFSSDHDVAETVSLLPLHAGEKIELEVKDRKIIFEDLREKEEGSYLTVTTAEDIVLSRIRLKDGEKIIKLEKTVDSELIKTPEGIFHTRTLYFPGKGREIVLERMTFAEEYNQEIRIELE